MIQLGLDIPTYVKGFFTLERDLLNKNLFEMESLLGYQKGRLKQGADILILSPPTRATDFEVMGTTVFPGHKFENSPLQQSINSNSKKERDLSIFRRQRLIKVAPLQIHMDAMKKYLTEEEYLILKDTDTKGKSKHAILKELRSRFKSNAETLKIIEQNFDKSQEIYQRQAINDKLYPSARRGIYQWRLNTKVRARCVCRLTSYYQDRYTRML